MEEENTRLETLFETKSLTDQLLFDSLHQGLQKLGRKINNFIKAVEREHNSNQVNEPDAEYYNQSSGIENQVSCNNYPEA